MDPITAEPITVYLLPGVGCDGRLFDRLDLEGFRVERLEWPAFRLDDDLAAIARRMRSKVDAGRPHVLVGVSMGGMVAQELAVLTKPERVVLISSWTGPQEWTPFVNFAARWHLQGLIRGWTMRAVWPLKRMLDVRSTANNQLLWDMALKQTAKQLRLGVGAVLRWQGSPWHGPLVRIHGDKDIVTPMRFPVDHCVQGGKHIMVLENADKVSVLLRDALTR